MAKKNPPNPPRGIVDKRATEKAHAYVQQMTKGRDFGSLEELNQFLGENLSGKRLDDMELAPATPAEAAQAKMYEAFDARSSAKRIALAKEALQIFPDCADAYVLLAEETEELEKALKYYKQGVEAGRRALGDAYIEEHAGSLWFANGRPYMRAMYGVAQCLFELEQYDEVISIAKEMLQLNENDNQGARYLLITALISSKQFAEAKKFLNKSKNDISSHILYSRALVLFHTSKDKKAAEKALFEALTHNMFIAPLLLTPELIPDGPLPDSYSIGSFEEAFIYCASNQQCWHSDVDTFKWLMTMCSTHMLAMASSLQRLEEEASQSGKGFRQAATEGGDNVLDLNFFLNNNR